MLRKLYLKKSIPVFLPLSLLISCASYGQFEHEVVNHGVRVEIHICHEQLTPEQQAFIAPIAASVSANLKQANQLIKEYFDVNCKKHHSEFMATFDSLLQSIQRDILFPLKNEAELVNCSSHYGHVVTLIYNNLKSFYEILGGELYTVMQNFQKRGEIKSFNDAVPLILELQAKGDVVKKKFKNMEPSINKLYVVLQNSPYVYIIDSIKQVRNTLQTSFESKSQIEKLTIFKTRLVRSKR